MKIGDLVQKRWGRLDPHQQDTVGIVIDLCVEQRASNPALNGQWLVVYYPGSGLPPYRYRPQQFEVISEGR